jgi:tetratricopeptide (TPR) repeat protein
VKAWILSVQGRVDESIVEFERALALDPAMVAAIEGLGWHYIFRGQFEKGLEFSDKAIRLSPHDPGLESFYRQRAVANFGLKQYDRTIEWFRRAIAIKPTHFAYVTLIAALALAGHDAEAHEALQNYLASVPDGPKTIAAVKATIAQC